ncbi:MAG: saccharopine dehydrogenase NADP-binding domain-containing protein [Myxococcales bacterium]|nr:saccharopine dehydrogenase NADP-binding domain-containing protein [Myxococcales bacterium]
MRVRDRSRAHDIVLFGATGFTGQLVAEYLARHAPEGVRVALAGRSRSKLEAVRAALVAIDPRAGGWPLRIADSHDRASLDAVARDAEVVCTTVGPYAKYGAELVAACVEHGTDYCDLTGETQFVRRMIDAHHERARETGARIVHCCGFDSIPSDLGTLMMQDEAQRRFGEPLQRVTYYAGETKGGFSGGTIASLLNVLEEAKRDRSVLKVLGDPYALRPAGDARGPDGPDQKGVRFDPELGQWTAPFVMAAVNTRIVRRTNAILDYPWGRDFRYAEVMSTGKGARGLARATTITGVLGGFMGLAAIDPIRKLLAAKVLPKPGEGPSKEQRDAGFFVIRFIGKTASGRELRGRVEGTSDPGYGETAKMLGESALCLALGGPSEGGVRTPASTMGLVLLERLRAAGMVFEVQP